jgi:surface polysaccharide O-acyltransferase-like enzyme
VVPFVLSGGRTIYYFFVSLMLLTLITHAAKRLSLKQVAALFLLSLLVVGLLPVASIRTGAFNLSAYWNPLNFLPYPFAAALLSHADRAGMRLQPLRLACFAALTLLLCALDWTAYVNRGFFEVNIYALPAYARPSLVLLAMAVVYLGIRARPEKNRLLQFAADNSLALYCLHPFFQFPAERLTSKPLIAFVIVVVFSYGAAAILKLFLREELIK